MAKKYLIHKLTDSGEQKATARELFELMRAEDRREVAACASDIYAEIVDDIETSDECWAGFDKKTRALIAVWGICKMPNRRGRLIWCLGTYQIKHFWVAFASESRKIVRRWARRYGCLYNAVGTFNTDSIRWLQWCGAEFDKEVMIGGEKFLPFRIEGGRKDV